MPGVRSSVLDQTIEGVALMPGEFGAYDDCSYMDPDEVPALPLSEEEIRSWIAKHEWRFARSMPWLPHWYGIGPRRSTTGGLCGSPFTFVGTVTRRNLVDGRSFTSRLTG